jgi:hypothetical protein
MWRFLERRRQNVALLRRALEAIGAEFEARPYDGLTKGADELSFEREFEGVRLSFSAEAYRTKKNGDLCFCIDACGLPTFPYPGPSWHFYKRRDGSVYY